MIQEERILLMPVLTMRKFKLKEGNVYVKLWGECRPKTRPLEKGLGLWHAAKQPVYLSL